MKKNTLILPVLLIALSACDNPYVPPTPDPETFEVTFCNYDESVLYVDVVKKGEDALYEGETPTRPDDSEYTYTFSGWDKELSNVQEDFTTLATYTRSAIGGGGDVPPPTPPEPSELSVQEGTILHAWNWSMDTIKNNLDAIKEAGFTTIQTSPMQPQKDYSPNEHYSSWWKLYQPLGLSVATKNHSLGTKDDLKELCDAAEEKGLKIIVDVVTNHLGGGGSESFNPDVRQYEPVIYDNNLLHRGVGYVNDNNVRQVTKGYMGDYPDLMTEDKRVQERTLSLLKEYIDVGVSGFRFDATKHIETPDDGSEASDFWPTILNGATNYALSLGKDEPYYYGEILNTPGSGRSWESYTKMMSITDNGNGAGIMYAAINRNANEVANNLYYRAGNDASKLVLWAESHDTFANEGGISEKVDQDSINLAYAIQASRADATSLYFVRPTNNMILGQYSSDSWKTDIVKYANIYHNTFVGVDEYLYHDSNAYVNVRDDGLTSGAMIVALGDKNVSNFDTEGHLDDGSYTDPISGNVFTVSGGKISGNVSSIGVAILMNYEPSTNLSLSYDAPSYFIDSTSVTLNVMNATASSYQINGGSWTNFNDVTTFNLNTSLPYGRNVINVRYSNDEETKEEEIIIYRLENRSNTIQIYGSLELSEANVYAWIWADGHEGEWVKTTYQNGVLTFSINSDMTHMLLARFNSGVNNPSWGQEIKQTNDYALNDNLIVNYDDLSWK